MIGDLTFHHVAGDSNALFDEAMAIYLASFPSNERRPVANIALQLAENKANLHVGIIDNEVVSMALLWRFSDSEFLLLDYLAVKSELRNLNVGARMFQYLAVLANKDNRYIIIEVENYLFGDNNLQKKKRVNFYIRNGCYLLLDVPYKLPALDGTLPTEMLLMIYPRHENDSGFGLKVKNLVTDLYLNHYEIDANAQNWLSIIDGIPLAILQDNTEII